MIDVTFLNEVALSAKVFQSVDGFFPFHLSQLQLG